MAKPNEQRKRNQSKIEQSNAKIINKRIVNEKVEYLLKQSDTEEKWVTVDEPLGPELIKAYEIERENRKKGNENPTDADDLFIVDTILRKRTPRGRVEYLVKWLGFDDPHDNTWEPARNLTPELIANYERRERERRSSIKKPLPREEINGNVSAISPDAGPSNESSNADDTTTNREDDDGELSFLQRGLEPIEILGVADHFDQTLFLMKFVGVIQPEWVTIEEAKAKCPQIVIDYYEKCIFWD